VRRGGGRHRPKRVSDGFETPKRRAFRWPQINNVMHDTFGLLLHEV
jgi:hypothetical protein